MIRALLVCLALYGTARAAPITEQECHDLGGEYIPHTREGGFPACGFGDLNIVPRADLDRIEATLKALCEHSGATCPKETRP